MKIQPKKGTKKVIHRESIPKRKIPKFTTAFAAFILLHLLLLENFKELDFIFDQISSSQAKALKFLSNLNS